MTGQKSVKNNMMMSIILTVSNFVFPVIIYSYVARLLGTSGTGKVAFANSILQYFTYIATLGIPTYGLRECAKVRDDRRKLSRIVKELLIINAISSCVAYAALTVTVAITPRLYVYKELFLVMSISIPLNTLGMEWVYGALEEYSYITIRSLLFKALSVILAVFLIRASDDYLWYGFISIFTVSASNVCNLFNIRKYIDFTETEISGLKKHLRPIFTLFAASIVITIYANFDISMIGFIRSEDEVGIYSAAVKIKGILLSLSTAITNVIIPRISYYIQQGQLENIKKLARYSFRVSMVLALPTAIYVFIFAENVLYFVCGPGYAAASSTLRILMLCIIPLILTNLFGNQLLVPLGKEKRYTESVFVGGLIDIALNLLLIPSLGSFGAAVGTLVAESWNVFWMSRGVREYRRMLQREISWRQYLLPMIASGTFSLFVSARLGGLHVFLQLVITSLVFFGTYYGLLILCKEPLINQQISNGIQRLKKYKGNRLN